jgi:SAM-dependent methyltransferase
VIDTEHDAFGMAFRDHFAGREAPAIIERDDGLVEVGPTEYYAMPFDEWAPEARTAIGLAGKRVLDVGCGAGRVALHLDSIGVECIAIDNSPGAIEVCRQRGVRDARLMSFTQIDNSLIADGHGQRRLDTVVMYGANFGLFSSFRRARWLLRRLKRLTTPDARIIAETVDPYETDRPEHIRYHERNRERGRMGGQVRIRVRYREIIGPWFDLLFVSRPELVSILDGTGWKLEQLLGGTGSAYIAIIGRE